MKHYIRREKESKVFTTVMIVVLLLMIIVVILEGCGMFEEPLWKPVAEYPFTNKYITLEGAHIFEKAAL